MGTQALVSGSLVEGWAFRATSAAVATGALARPVLEQAAVSSSARVALAKATAHTRLFLGRWHVDFSTARHSVNQTWTPVNQLLQASECVCAVFANSSLYRCASCGMPAVCIEKSWCPRPAPRQGLLGGATFSMFCRLCGIPFGDTLSELAGTRLDPTPWRRLWTQYPSPWKYIIAKFLDRILAIWWSSRKVECIGRTCPTRRPQRWRGLVDFVHMSSRKAV